MRPDLLNSLALAWIRDDWATYNETLADMTEYELRETAKVLRLMSESMTMVRHKREMDVDQER
jgi:hypothetical protein